MLPQKSNKENGLDAPKIIQGPPLPRSGSGGAAALGAVGFQAELNCLVVGCLWKEVVPGKSRIPNPSSYVLGGSSISLVSSLQPAVISRGHLNTWNLGANSSPHPK